jgi:4-amino-4-deoxy-L-arabinose transferase-like glycosyltransferase
MTRLLPLLIIILLLGSLYRGWVLATTGLDLYLDEAQYWFWAKDLSWGYYSKPPVIAWAIAVSTALCGSDSEFCVRLPSLFFYPLTSLVIFFLGKHLYNEKIGFWSAIVFFSIPAVSLSSLLISTDVILFFFWALSLYVFVKALENNQWRYWLLLGVVGGLGLLTKYTMGIFAISVLVFLLSTPSYRHYLASIQLWVAALVAGLMMMPNLIWNYQNEFPTFQHTAEISNLNSQKLHFNEMREFLIGQFFVFGFIFFPLLMLIWLAFTQWFNDWKMKLLVIFSGIFLFIIILQSLFGRANANWAAPTYVTATIMIVAWALLTPKKIRVTVFYIGLLVNVLFIPAIYHHQSIMRVLGIELTQENDAYKRSKGWRALAAQVAVLQEKHSNSTVLAQDRELIAELTYYLPQPPADVVSWNPQGKVRHHYDLVTSMDERKGNDFIYIGSFEDMNSFSSFFSKVKPIEKLTVKVNSDFYRTYQVWLMKGFKGY